MSIPKYKGESSQFGEISACGKVFLQLSQDLIDIRFTAEETHAPIIVSVTIISSRFTLFLLVELGTL
jgi:hypothetical protein